MAIRMAISRLPVPIDELIKTPNPKHQAPGKFQSPNAAVLQPDWSYQIGAWGLELLWCLELGVWCFHSYLSASIGSTRAARRAGSQQASKATAMRASDTA